MNTTEASAKVAAVEGPVESTGGKLSVGSNVGEGQAIKTGENGFVTLKLADGSMLVVQSKSQVRLDVARVIANTSGIPLTRAKLDAGRVEARVEKRSGGFGRFEIVTPTLNMGVRGTQFRASSEEGGKASRGEVLEGTDACFAPVLDWDEAPLHPHNAARGTYLTLDGILQPAPAPRFSRTANDIPAPARAVSVEDALESWSGRNAAARF